MGTDRYYKMEHGMWPKSSKRFADRIEKNTLKIGLGLGALLIQSLSRPSQLPTVSAPYSPKSLSTPTDRVSMAKTSRTICITLLILTPIFQALGYVAYVWWGWWPFFALLLFSSIAILLLGVASLSAEDMQYLNWRKYKQFEITVTVMLSFYFVSNLWPIFVSDGTLSSFTCILMAFQMVFAVLITINTWREYNKKKIIAKKVSSKPIATPHTRSTSRTSRIKDMEERYDRVKVAFSEVLKAEEKLGKLSEDIDVLREYIDSGKWQKDFEADEQGKLPKDLKRGVLSEDELWNLLEEVEERV